MSQHAHVHMATTRVHLSTVSRASHMHTTPHLLHCPHHSSPVRTWCKCIRSRSPMCPSPTLSNALSPLLASTLSSAMCIVARAEARIHIGWRWVGLRWVGWRRVGWRWVGRRRGRGWRHGRRVRMGGVWRSRCAGDQIWVETRLLESGPDLDPERSLSMARADPFAERLPDISGPAFESEAPDLELERSLSDFDPDRSLYDPCLLNMSGRSFRVEKSFFLWSCFDRSAGVMLTFSYDLRTLSSSDTRR
mmetsp:Transcript_72182/g.143195  ORF Transcript_72182/g.143195 Transcript_72182/m.143195 type:complete len:248 (+) Transcript_72182:290-1033(+)